MGARQVGKTTLLKSLSEQLKSEQRTILYLNCDVREDLAAINTTSLTQLTKLTSGTDYLFIDEAQRLDNPGLTLKILFDALPAVKILATGSSSFDLKNKSTETLAGRYIDYTLYPLSLGEVLQVLPMSTNTLLQQKQADSLLDEILLYGLYPEIYLAKKRESKILMLQKIIESYLFKDVLSFGHIRNAQAIADLTRALAYQIGSEVNENELANRLKIDRKTVVSYLDILEQAFIIVRLWPYSKNPRREIGKNYKVYFTDIGIRNALIGDFNPLAPRRDQGALWENFLIVERIKTYAQRGVSCQYYFWRSYSGAEVDYLEKPMAEPEVSAFEIKYNQGSLSRGTASFSHVYHIPVTLVNKQNYLTFLA